MRRGGNGPKTKATNQPLRSHNAGSFVSLATAGRADVVVAEEAQSLASLRPDHSDEDEYFAPIKSDREILREMPM